MSQNFRGVCCVALMTILIFHKQPGQLLQGHLPFPSISSWLETWTRSLGDLLVGQAWDSCLCWHPAWVEVASLGSEVGYCPKYRVQLAELCMHLQAGLIREKVISCSPPRPPPRSSLQGRCFLIVPLLAHGCSCSSSGGLNGVSPMEKSALILLDPGSCRELVVCFPNLFVEQ